ncbi:MAG: putative DNA binding domain-containing protein [Candidatus Caldatribacteriota bacterium]|nr:putative DNA binding domain-containing protein [Candidatus Caldatribacteriota bacterium]
MNKLPININDLINARTVEWERLEFKEGWNPEDVLHTMCAFANDFHNLGGGYIFLGIKEKNGRPVLPPKGLYKNIIDKIQKEIIELGYKIQPYYHPIVFPCMFKKKQVLVLWSIGGQSRPYKAPVSLSKSNNRYAYYIRKASETVIAKTQDEKELFELASKIPFDDRMHHTVTIKDLDLGLIRGYLQQVKSDLFSESAKMDFVQLCRNMNIVDGPEEYVRPKNVGLMFFNPEPHRFFPQTQVDVVHFPDGPGADSFSEKSFKGPLDRMLTDALNYIKSQFIEEKVQKFPDRAEAERRYNYPYVAIEEILTNAVYHRSYEIREPIEVRILPDRITIGSFPGPDRSITDEDMQKCRFISRRYRNRRIGEFLKELDMTEGRGTGIPKILQAIKKNDSPKPIFHTDEDRSYFVVELLLHPAFAKDKEPELQPELQPELRPELPLQGRILYVLRNGEFSKSAIAEKIGHKTVSGELNKQVRNLIRAGLIEYTIPKKPNSPKQKYRLTSKGQKVGI